MIIRTYSELSILNTFEDRYKYLQFNGIVGEETFGFYRYLNQMLYNSYKWRKIRDIVIIRDDGCDLGIEGRVINGIAIIHHMNPISRKDIETESDLLFNPEYLITTTHLTHNAIHYSDEKILNVSCNERSKDDMCPWRH